MQPKTRARRKKAATDPSPRAPKRPSARRMTIEELSSRTGLTVRHLRELQSKRVLDSPELEGRKAFYDERHVARVALVRRLQDRGYSLAAIADFVTRWQKDGGARAVQGLEDAIQHRPDGPDRPLSDSELRRLHPEIVGDRELLSRAIAADLIRREGDALVAPSAQLLHVGWQFVEAGMSVDAVFAEFEQLRADCRQLAQRFRENFAREILAPMQAEGLPAERLSELSRAIVTLRAAAVRAVSLLMTEAMYGTTAPPDEPPHSSPVATRRGTAHGASKRSGPHGRPRTRAARTRSPR